MSKSFSALDKADELRAECWKDLLKLCKVSGDGPREVRLEPMQTREAWKWIARKIHALEQGKENRQ